VKRKMSSYPLRPRKRSRTQWLFIASHIKILK